MATDGSEGYEEFPTRLIAEVSPDEGGRAR